MNAYGKIRAIAKLDRMGVTVPKDADARDVADIINMVLDRPISNQRERADAIIERFLSEGEKPKLYEMQPLKQPVYPPGVMERIQSFRAIPSLYE